MKKSLDFKEAMSAFIKNTTWEFFYEGYRLAESNSTQQSRDRTDDEIRAMFENEFEASNIKEECEELKIFNKN